MEDLHGLTSLHSLRQPSNIITMSLSTLSSGIDGVRARFRVLNGFDTFGGTGKCMPSAEELYEEKRERVFSLLRVVMEVLPHVRVTITKHAKATAPQ